METDEKAPRAIYVRLGVPKEMREANAENGFNEDGPQMDEGVNLDECYMIDFAEQGAEEGFSIFTSCLCMLAKLTEAWLTEQVSTYEEMQALMKDHSHGT